ARLEDCQLREERWVYQAPEPILLDHVVLQEDLTDGEQIRRFAIKVIPCHYRTPITVYEGYNIGHKAICAFPPVRAREVWVDIVEADAPPKLRAMELHLTG
ncbi:MAG: hypothetical protein HUU35_15145, partial [Armatimonadetes bacterium]|nr:hypothetical protein [Armatimonadota bacterium]